MNRMRRRKPEVNGRRLRLFLFKLSSFVTHGSLHQDTVGEDKARQGEGKGEKEGRGEKGSKVREKKKDFHFLPRRAWLSLPSHHSFVTGADGYTSHHYCYVKNSST